VIYGDSSFLIAIYRRGDAFHAGATNLIARLKQPMALTLLAELELHNGVHRCLAERLVNQGEHDAIFRQIAQDETDGILVRSLVEESALYAEARKLSRKFTPETSARSLDILHVAAAKVLRASPFISFDAKQRLLVQKTGMVLLPRTLPSKSP
jgi:predicted nucleic acid-binding protein